MAKRKRAPRRATRKRKVAIPTVAQVDAAIAEVASPVETRGGAREGAGRPRRVITAPPELVEELRACTSCRALFQFDKNAGVAHLEGKLATSDLEGVLAMSRECRQALKVARAERAEKRVRALEVLTPQEAAALEAYRASIRPKPIMPGEYVQPPPEPPGGGSPPAAA